MAIWPQLDHQIAGDIAWICGVAWDDVLFAQAVRPGDTPRAPLVGLPPLPPDLPILPRVENPQDVNVRARQFVSDLVRLNQHAAYFAITEGQQPLSQPRSRRNAPHPGDDRTDRPRRGCWIDRFQESVDPLQVGVGRPCPAERHEFSPRVSRASSPSSVAQGSRPTAQPRYGPPRGRRPLP